MDDKKWGPHNFCKGVKVEHVDCQLSSCRLSVDRFAKAYRSLMIELIGFS